MITVCFFKGSQLNPLKVLLRRLLREHPDFEDDPVFFAEFLCPFNLTFIAFRSQFIREVLDQGPSELAGVPAAWLGTKPDNTREFEHTRELLEAAEDGCIFRGDRVESLHELFARLSTKRRTLPEDSACWARIERVPIFDITVLRFNCSELILDELRAEFSGEGPSDFAWWGASNNMINGFTMLDVIEPRTGSWDNMEPGPGPGDMTFRKPL